MRPPFRCRGAGFAGAAGLLAWVFLLGVMPWWGTHAVSWAAEDGSSPSVPPLSRQDLTLRDAAAKPDLAQLKALLKQGANPNSVDDDGVTPLMIAVVGDVERVRALAEQGLGRAWQDGLKKVVKAVRGDAPAMAALLDAGAQVNEIGRASCRERV